MISSPPKPSTTHPQPPQLSPISDPENALPATPRDPTDPTGPAQAPRTHIEVDKTAYDPQVVVRRASARKMSEELKEKRGEALGRMRIIDLPQGKAKRVDEAFSTEVRFNLSEPEPAVQAGAHGVPDGVSTDLSISTAGDLALVEHASRIPTHENVTNGDGTVSRVPISPDEQYRRAVADVFSRAFALESKTLDDTLPMRVRVVWRLTRELARMKGLAMSDEPMSAALVGDASNPDPWQVPEAWTEPSSREARRDLWPEVVDTFRTSEDLPEALQVHLWVAKDLHKPDQGAEKRSFPGFALMPPPVPPMWRDMEGGIADNYDPKEDQNLNLFLSAISDITERLQIAQGSRLDPDQGTSGLRGLLDPALMRLCWPTRVQVLTWEAMLIEETLDIVVKAGVSEAKKLLKDRYGLGQREILGLLRMASALAQEQTAGDREDSRAIMVLRLEGYIRRSKDALDLKSEMLGLKQLSTVLGLADTNNSDPMTEFLNAVREVSAERKVQPRELIDENHVPSEGRIQSEVPLLENGQ